MQRRILAGFVAVIGAVALAVTGHASPSTASADAAAAQPNFTCVVTQIGHISPCGLICHRPTCTVATPATADAAQPDITCVTTAIVHIQPCRLICLSLTACPQAPMSDASATTGVAAPKSSPGYVCNIFAVLNGTCKPALCLSIRQVCPQATTSTSIGPGGGLCSVQSVEHGNCNPSVCMVVNCPQPPPPTVAMSSSTTASPGYVCTLQAELDGTCKPSLCISIHQFCPDASTTAPDAARIGN